MLLVLFIQAPEGTAPGKPLFARSCFARNFVPKTKDPRSCGRAPFSASVESRSSRSVSCTLDSLMQTSALFGL